MKWVTLFPSTKNENLAKDVGMIPFHMYKNHQFESYIVCFKNEDNYSYLNNVVKGLNIKYIKKENRLLAQVKYLIKNSKGIDVLNLYHWGRITLLSGLLYKILNPKGVLYVKTDMDFRSVKILQTNIRARIVFRLITRVADVVTVESTKVKKLLEQCGIKRIKYLTNGFIKDSSENEIIKKEKIILTVGRLGTRQKASEILLESFCRIENEIKDWKLIFVGTIEPDFNDRLIEIQKNRSYGNRIIYTGKIVDKEVLDQYYKKAAIFALPSRWESFALVMLESMSKGCYFVGTDQIAPIDDVVCDSKYGLIAVADNIEAFTENLKRACLRYDSIDSVAITDYIYNNFTWDKVCENLYEMLRLGK